MTYKNINLQGRDPAHTDARDYLLYDLNTGEQILNVVWANDETGEYCVMLRNEHGQPYLDKETGEVATEVKTGNIQLRIHRG